MKKQKRQEAEIPVHPAANVFPMMLEDELQSLAKDIKANGLQEPLKIRDGRLIDGRNRRAACRIAGVEPTIEELNGSIEPEAYVIAKDIHRRHMNKGAQAMAVAVIYPEPEKRGGGNIKSLIIKEFTGGYLSMARTVLRYAPELKDGVLNGGKGLNEAYEEAIRRKAAAESEEIRRRELRRRASDLADLVNEGKMTLSEAEDKLREREEKYELARRAAIRNMESVLLHLTSEARGVSAEKIASGYDDVLDQFDEKKLQFAAQTMVCIAKHKKEGGGK